MIYLAADHRGFELKEKIKLWLTDWGYDFEDYGNTIYDKNDDYPDFVKKLVKSYLLSVNSNQQKQNNKTLDAGIVICGSGIGVSVSANRFAGIRCALGFNVDQVQHGRRHDHINMLAIPADYLDDELVKKIIETFLRTGFESQERFLRRIGKLEILR